MKIAIVTSRYPSKDNYYNHMFVHTRSLYFIKQKDIQLTVYVPSKKDYEYVFENVKVICSTSKKIAIEILAFDLVYLHLLNIYPNKMLSGWSIYKSIIDNNKQVVMYLHGSEVQKYYKFDFIFSIKEILKYFYKDFYFIPKMRKFIKVINQRENSMFIAPSLWMIEEAQENLSVKFNNFEIIPNGIDTDMFNFFDSYQNRYKIITLRPLESQKYAIDVAIETMRYLPKHFSLDIYGKGKYRDKFIKLIKQYNLENRVHIINKFIDRKDLPNLFSYYGIALMPSRMDAQGVSMCEMMSSGLLTISSYSTAIPEFIIDMQNGILGENSNPKELADKIVKVVENMETYQNICNNGRYSMEKINIDITMKRELNVFKKII